MVKCPRYLLVMLFLVVALPGASRAQSPVTDSVTSSRRDSISEVRLRDGSVLYGRVVQEDAAHLTLRTSGGTQVDVRCDQVVSVRRTAGRIVNGEVWADDPNGTRLLFTSTGRPLGKGEGYVSAYFLFLPFVAYGFTDKLTIAAGTPIIPGAIGRAFYVAPKYTLVSREKSSYAIGALSFATTEEISDGTVGLAYGVGTWGSRDNAITAGAGWGYSWSKNGSGVSNAPVIVLGGETRISRRVKLVTENWFYTGSGVQGAFISGGFRFIGDRLSSDLGLLGLAGGDGVGCCIPTVNFVWNFGRQKR